MNKINKTSISIALIVLISSIGVLISSSILLFYNILIMPLIGFLYYTLVNERRIINFIVLILSIKFTFMIHYYFIQKANENFLQVFLMSLQMTFLFLVFILLGVIIAALISIFKKKNFNKLMRYSSLFLSICIFISILLFANGFLGNPISKYLTKIKVDKYIENNYNDFDYKINKITYDFKSGGYSSHISSKKHLDYDFFIRTDSLGKIKSDNYKMRVTKMDNVLRRFRNEYRGKIKEVLEAPEYKDLNIYFNIDIYSEKNYDLDKLNLKHEMQFDFLKLGKKIGIINIHFERYDKEKIINLIVKLKKHIDEVKMGLNKINIQIKVEKEKVEFYNYEILYEEIERSTLNKELKDK